MSDDLIKRSDALSAAGDMSYIAFEIRRKIRMIPSADAPSADRPQGEWELCEDDDGIYGVCSICGVYAGGIMERPAVLLETIDEAPTIDRPSGEWIDRGMRVPSSWVKKCSLCGHETDTWRWCKFCPNCGAKMVNGEGGE